MSSSSLYNKVWQAQYIDKKFYCADPHSINKLKQLERLISLEKIKLNLENQPTNKQIDMLSVDEYGGVSHNEIEYNDSKTQLNHSKYKLRNDHVETELMRQESKLRENQGRRKNKQQPTNNSKIQNNLSNSKINNAVKKQQGNNNNLNEIKESKHSSLSKKNINSKYNSKRQSINQIQVDIKGGQNEGQNKYINSKKTTPRFNQQLPNNQSQSNIMRNSSAVSSKSKKNLQQITKLNSKISQLQKSLIDIEKKQKKFQQIEKVYRQEIDKTIINQREARKQLVQDNNHQELQNNKTINMIIEEKQSLSAVKSNNNNFGIVSSIVNINTAQQIQQRLQKQNQEKQKQRMKNQIQHLRKTVRQLKLQKIYINDPSVEKKLVKDNKDDAEKIVTQPSKQIQRQLILPKEKHPPQIQIIKDKVALKQQMQEQQDLKKFQQIQQLKVVKQTWKQPINNEELNQQKNLPNPVFLRNRKLKQAQILPVTIQYEPKSKQTNQFPKFQSINLEISQKVNVGKIVKNSPMKQQISSNPKKQFNIRVSSSSKNDKSIVSRVQIQQQQIKQKQQLNKKQQLKQKQQIKQKQQKKHSFMNNLAFHDTSRTMAIKKNDFSKIQQNKVEKIKKSHTIDYQIKKQLKMPPQSSLSKRGIFAKYIKPDKNQKIKSQIDQKPQKQNNRYFEFQIQTQRSKDEGRKLFELEFKKKNQNLDQPQQQQFPIAKQIKLDSIDFPKLINCPNAKMSAQQMMSLARETFQLFGVKLDKSINNPREIRMVKFKNCILFKADKVNDKILWHYSGKFYYGGWKQGEGQGTKSGEGYQYAPGKYWYKGQFLDGKKNGSGRLQFVDGCNYIGQFSQGNRCGQGKFYDQESKSYYEGQWKDNKKQGSGYLRISQKQYYIGTFSKNLKNGYGIQCYPNGDRYKGQYQNGKFNGKGKYMWSNGSWYEGKFANGYRQGNGKWKSGKNGDCYIGEYRKDKKHGFGKYFWANGYIYEGNFQNDLKDGEGKMKYDNEKQIKGLWFKGQLKQIKQEKTENQTKFILNKTIDLHKLNPQRMPKIKFNQNQFDLSKNLYLNSEGQQKSQKNIKMSIQKPSKKLQIPSQIGKI